MKMDKKDSKKIIISVVVIILIVIGTFIVVNKSKNAKIVTDAKNKSAVNSGEVNKNAIKTSKGDATATTTKPGQNSASVANGNITSNGKTLTAAQQAKSKATKVVSSKEGITVFVKAANFGSMADFVIDSSKTSSDYKYYQYSLGNKSISKVESITKLKTTMFPAQEGGTEVTLKLMGQNNKVIKQLNIKLSVK